MLKWWMYVPIVIYLGGLNWFFFWGINKENKEASKNKKENK